jgi:uncharacterized membrane protein YhiD involved in acid resistance
MLVAMGSALIVLVSLQSGVDTANAARVVQGSSRASAFSVPERS